MMLRVPPTFFEDHLDRCGLEPESSVVRKTKDAWIVELVPADIADLYSDAVHYRESGTQTYGMESLGLVSSARATCNGLVKQLGAELDHILAATRAAAQAAKEALEADPVWIAERDARRAAEAERAAARALLERTNPMVAYTPIGAQLTLELGHRWEVVGRDYAELLVRPVGATLPRAACRRLAKPIGRNGSIDSQARILDVKHVVEYHHPEEN